jgi:hypothetical protein
MINSVILGWVGSFASGILLSLIYKILRPGIAKFFHNKFYGSDEIMQKYIDKMSQNPVVRDIALKAIIYAEQSTVNFVESPTGQHYLDMAEQFFVDHCPVPCLRPYVKDIIQIIYDEFKESREAQNANMVLITTPSQPIPAPVLIPTETPSASAPATP